jgi:hypothetical protein
MVTVMEVLRVYFDLPEADVNFGAAGSLVVASAQLSTRSQTAFSSAFPGVFAYSTKTLRGAFTAAGTYAVESKEPFVYELTDGAGHGVLIATDNIYFGCITAAFAAAGTFAGKVLYRMKNVTLAEYIGIVQSQQ